MATTEILLATGERVEVQGGFDEVEACLVSAARGAMLELARLVQAAGGRPLAVNPAAVIALRPGSD